MKILFIIPAISFLFVTSGCGLDKFERETRDWQSVSLEGEQTESDEGEESSEQASEETSVTDTSTDPSSSTQTNNVSGSYPDLSSAESEEGDTGAEEENESVDEATSETSETEGGVEAFNWARVLLTEVVTDPQQDHSESSGGNGVFFDSVAGSGTVGSTDEYVEIFNGTTEAVNLSLWHLSMSDGTDEEQSFGDENEYFYFSSGGSVEAIEPGEFIVLGNPSGSMNNTIDIELLNEMGEVVDSVSVDDANANDLDDEAWYRLPDGGWGQGRATPGYFPAETSD